jgi:hypothetical protein
MDDFDIRTRRPRHEAQPGAEYRLVVTVQTTGEKFAAQLADLSRQGLKAVTERELGSGETVEIQLELPENGGLIQLSKEATVRWVKLQDDGHWALGLQFPQELPWEIMGELFLGGVLNHHTDTDTRKLDVV